MDVYDAVRTRQSIRRFTDRPVAREHLQRVLAAAANAPSGSNLQPWHVYMVSGEPLTELKRRVAERVAAGDRGDDREFAIYPPELRSPYLERLAALGEARYGSLGIARDDVATRARFEPRTGTASEPARHCSAIWTGTCRHRGGPTRACTYRP
ncbi:nitroreductase family protein [Micromonospora sp. WMMD1102]|uniref:nitroreductase family protein n=1 Tax=Micromonospora sp. WMMD1102 TaxID=3016105 RepID=UPI00241594C8|nr:nitroreductase family protein [Micromonospora sp. WMMD1102]MDG4786296.1 nitroreductase family protein [Micromonospora sp. WMMD1102]